MAQCRGVHQSKGTEYRSSGLSLNLLDVEGKIFLSVMAKHITAYLLKNNYIDIVVQKGVVVPGLSGCLEHTCMISEIIKAAREKTGGSLL
jgi:hypothetical protein